MEKKINETNMHDDFDDKLLRELLSKKLHWKGNLGVLLCRTEEELKFELEEFEKAKRRLERAKELYAYNQVLKDNGWEAWDISEEITYNPETYRDFIGTSEDVKKVFPGYVTCEDEDEP